MLCLILGSLIIILLLTHRTREGYGGPIKKIRRIPFTSCSSICDQYKDDCLKKYSDTDAGWCYELFGEGCKSECYYSNYHRL